jgi:hypothetical protein
MALSYSLSVEPFERTNLFRPAFVEALKEGGFLAMYNHFLSISGGFANTCPFLV